MLPLLPLFYALGFEFVYDRVIPAIFVRGAGTRIAVGVGHVTLICAVTWCGSDMLRHFVADHSPSVFAASRWIDERSTAETHVVGDFPSLHYYFGFRYTYERHGLDYEGDAAAYLDVLIQWLQLEDADYVMFSRKWLGGRPRALLEGDVDPSKLRCVYNRNGAVVYAVVGS